jgi:TolA-binding protein
VYRRAAVLAFLLCAAASLPGQEAESLYSSGERAFRDGLYLMAARSLRQLAENYPDHPLADDAEYLQALAEYYQRDYLRLLATLKDFPRRHPRSPFNSQVPFWMGSAHFQLGQYVQAVAQLTAQVQRFPQETEYGERALLLAGAALEKLGEWDEARDTYLRLLHGVAADSGLRAADNGLRAAEGGLRPETWFRLGSCQLVLQDYAGAFSSFTRVLIEHADSPQAEEAPFFAAESLYFSGRFGEAERRYRLVLEGEPSPERAQNCLYRLARIAARLERPSESLALVGELERRFPKGPYAPEYPLLSAEALFDLGQYPAAQAAYRRALAAAGSPADRQRISYSLALAALSAGDPGAALQPLRDSLTGGESSVAEKASFRLAAALAELGREAEALKAVGDFRSRYPGSELGGEALYLEASLLDRSGRGREARELYGQFLARYPFSPRKEEVLFQRASSFLAAGDTSSALRDFFAVTQGRPDSAYLAESRYNIGYIYSQRGEFARAMPYFAEALSGGASGAPREAGATRETAPRGELAVRATLASGVCQFNAGDYAQALAWFQRLEALPAGQAKQAQGWYYGGRALYKLERLAEAEERFARAASVPGPQREEALYWRAVSLFRLDRLGAARQAFLELESAFPAGPRAAEALYRAGTCAALAGEHPAALALFERALAAARRREAGSPPETGASRGELLQEILFQKGLSLLDSSGRAEAAAAFRSLAREFPGSALSAQGFLALAEADLRAGDYPEALAGFRLLTRDYRGQPAARGAQYWAGVAAARHGLAEEGLIHLLAYLEAEPSGGQARAAEEEIRRILYASQGDDRLLKKFLTRVEGAAIPLPLKQQARLEYALHVFRRDREQGLALLSALRDLQPEEPLAGEVHYWIGEGHRQRGDLDRALEIFTGLAASRADRTGALAQAGVARVREEQGRPEEAAEEYLKLYFLFPELKDLAPEGLYQASRLYREQGLRERAERLEQKLRAEFPDNPRAHE